MQRALVVLMLASLSVPLVAQDIRQQGSMLTWPSYTDQQRWQRAGFHAVTFGIGAISVAKAQGKTAEDAGRHIGDLFAPGWGPPNSGVPIRVARGMLFNVAAFPGTDAHLASATDTSATLRFRRAYYTAVLPDTGSAYGVTQAEYDRFFVQVNARIAAHLGLRVHYSAVGEWGTITFSGRGSNAMAAFPRGAAFKQTLTAEQAGAPRLAGSYVLTFSADGKFELKTAAGESKVVGRYNVMLDQLTVGEEDGPWACKGFGPGAYRFTPEPSGNILLGRLNDACEGRARFFNRRWLKS